MFVLLLNDMRSHHIEDLEPVFRAETREELIAFLQKEEVEHYSDPTGMPDFDPNYIPDNPHAPVGRSNPKVWGKCYRKGGPLEWYNKPFSLVGNPAIQNVGTEDKWASRARQDFNNRIMIIPQVPG